MMAIKEKIENMKGVRKKKDEISFAQFGKWYNLLNKNEKEAIDLIYQQLISEENDIDLPTMDNVLDEISYYKGLQDKNGGLLGYKTKLDFVSEYGEKTFDVISNGIIPGTVWTIAGYSNVGKSNFTYYLLSKHLEKRILFISTEVNKGMVLQNLVKSKYAINYNTTLSYINNNKEKIRKDFKNLTIIDNIREIDIIKNIVDKGDYDIVVLDFVQGLTAGNKEMYEKNAYIAREIQQMAINNKCNMFAVAQITAGTARDSKGNNNVFTLKGAGEYFESSDMILHLFRPEKTIPTDLILKLEKNKYGPLDNFEIEADYGKGQFIKS